MSDLFDDRKKALEEEYFRKKEQELMEKLKQRARAKAEREGLAEAAGVTNETGRRLAVRAHRQVASEAPSLSES